MITHTGDISYSCDMYGKKFTYKWQFKWVRVRVMVFNVHHFQQYISYIVAVSFIGGGNQSNRKKPPTRRKSLTNFIA